MPHHLEWPGYIDGAGFVDDRVFAALAAARTGVARPVFPSPPDWRDVWIYFLMVDRFAHPTNPPRRLPADADHGGFQGGTIAGVTAKLDYLAGLGAGAIWLSPVLRNPQWDEGAYHGYGIQDFLSIDPRFGTPSGLRSLVDGAHQRGLYVILDIVLNHTGDLFEYEGRGSEAPYRDDPPYPVRWRGADGAGRPGFGEHPVDPVPGVGVSPRELGANRHFRRRGNAFTPGRTGEQQEAGGDFFSLKELVTDGFEDGRAPVRDALISAYQYVMAAFDVDGYRIDTLKFVEPDFARVFGNAMREFALSIGKKNFFTFGEVYDNEDKIARFVGRQASQPGDVVGVDAALDFPLFYVLPSVAKGLVAPRAVVDVFENRKRAQRGVISSHGEASSYFVTFLDNHDQNGRFRFADPSDPGRFDSQVTLAVACLMSLQGIPCLYYGTETGLHGAGGRPEAVREALWGVAGAFDPDGPLARAVRAVSAVRASQPALRYGRQYFRPISGDGVGFGLSTFASGVLAWSRVLNDIEVVVVANTHTSQGWAGWVIVDRHLNQEGTSFSVLYSNRDDPGPPAPPEPVSVRPAGRVTVREVDGSLGHGPVHATRVALRPMEVQVLGR